MSHISSWMYCYHQTLWPTPEAGLHTAYSLLCCVCTSCYPLPSTLYIPALPPVTPYLDPPAPLPSPSSTPLTPPFPPPRPQQV